MNDMNNTAANTVNSTFNGSQVESVSISFDGIDDPTYADGLQSAAFGVDHEWDADEIAAVELAQAIAYRTEEAADEMFGRPFDGYTTCELEIVLFDGTIITGYAEIAS